MVEKKKGVYRLRQRVTIIVILFLLAIIFIFAMYKAYFYKPIEQRNSENLMEPIEALLDSHEDGDVITDKTDPKQAADEVNEKLGEYYTDKFAQEVEDSIRTAMDSDRDFKKDPARITFFLINKGDGLQFAPPEYISPNHRKESKNISNVEAIIQLPPDDPEWIGLELGLPRIKVVKEGWSYKINHVEKEI